MTTLPELKTEVRRHTQDEAIFSFVPAQATTPQPAVQAGQLDLTDRLTIDIEIDVSPSIQYEFVETILTQDLAVKNEATIGDIPTDPQDPRFIKVATTRLAVYIGRDSDSNIIYSYANLDNVQNEVSVRLTLRGIYNAKFPIHSERQQHEPGAVLVLNIPKNGYDLADLPTHADIADFLTADTLPRDLTKYPGGLARLTQIPVLPTPEAGKILEWNTMGLLVNVDKPVGGGPGGGLSLRQVQDEIDIQIPAQQRVPVLTVPNPQDFWLRGDLGWHPLPDIMDPRIPNGTNLTTGDVLAWDNANSIYQLRSIREGSPTELQFFGNGQAYPLRGIEGWNGGPDGPNKPDFLNKVNGYGRSDDRTIRIDPAYGEVGDQITWFNVSSGNLTVQHHLSGIPDFTLFNGQSATWIKDLGFWRMVEDAGGVLDVPALLGQFNLTNFGAVLTNVIGQRQVGGRLYSTNTIPTGGLFSFPSAIDTGIPLGRGDTPINVFLSTSNTFLSSTTPIGTFTWNQINDAPQEVINRFTTIYDPDYAEDDTGDRDDANGIRINVSGSNYWEPSIFLGKGANGRLWAKNTSGTTAYLVLDTPISQVAFLRDLLTPDTLPTDLTKYPAGLARDSELPAANRLIPVGGTDGQVLTKASGTDYDVAWEDAAGGGELTVTELDLQYSPTTPTATATTPAGGTIPPEILGTGIISIQVSGRRAFQGQTQSVNFTVTRTVAQFDAASDNSVFYSFGGSFLSVEVTKTTGRTFTVRSRTFGTGTGTSGSGRVTYPISEHRDFTVLVDVDEVIPNTVAQYNLEYLRNGIILQDMTFYASELMNLTATTAGTAISTLTRTNSKRRHFNYQNIDYAIAVGRTSADRILFGILNWTEAALPNPEFHFERLTLT